MAPGRTMISGEDLVVQDLSLGEDRTQVPLIQENGIDDDRLAQQLAQLNRVEGDIRLENGHAATNVQTTTNGHATTNGHITMNGHAATNGRYNGTAPNGDSNPGQSFSDDFSTSESQFSGLRTPTSNESVKAEAKFDAGMPIAVIGIAVRAGSASTPDEFFEMLSRGRSAWVPEIPKERFNNESFYHPNAGKLGGINTNGACFIQQDVTKFDAPFFSITELEATSMDPQQRLLLECAFEALDSAGIQKHATVGKDIGVFVGAGSPEYEFDLFRDSDTMPMFQATGNHLAMQSNKISHFFDWRGPSVTMDTACSSSLTAVHFACQSIRNRESDVALVGGCNLNLIPEFFINYSTSRLLGNDGKCFSFDERGTGYGRGEGCGMLLLKPLDQAIKDNDSVRAVIAASGVNQDGYTPGITMPNGAAQEALVRSIYRNAGLDPAQTGYVEAHGTGTRVGDPIEVTALHNVFNEGRTTRNPLYLGSVKSNIGHLESASGILAVIKTAVMLDRGFILPNYDFKVGNPKIPFADWGLKVPTRQLPWPRGKRFASVNNFGFGGTNAHIVMERPPPRISSDNSASNTKEDPTKRLFVLSAADKNACASLMSNLGVYLEQRPEMFQRDLMSKVAYTLGQRRSLLPWRVAVPAKESFELVEKLSNGSIHPVKETGAPRVGFVCTGQGAQWWAMGRELYDRYPVFTDVIDRASAILTELGALYSLVDELGLDEGTTRVNEAHISQPSCTAIQLGLIELLRSWGVEASSAVGHSSGEIAAAYSIGILSIESAMAIAYHRGRLIPVLKERYPHLQGGMIAVGCGKEDAEDVLQQINDGQARVACYNSPQSLTLSGDLSAINALSQVLEDKQIFNRRLVIETAYHSHHMDLIAEDYLEAIKALPEPMQATGRFFSSLTGKEAKCSEFDASYWVNNLTSPVKFAQACAHLVAPTAETSTGVDILIEIGPHSALQGPVKQILKQIGGAIQKIPYSPSLVRKKDAVDTMLTLASTLFCKGSQLDLANVNFPKSTKMPSLLVDLPRYPWNHSTTYWHESRITKQHKTRPFARHDLLGSLADYSNDLEPTWRNIVRLDDIPWLRHHKIQSLTIFPISGFVSMVVEAVAQEAHLKNIEAERIELQDVAVHTPLMIPDDPLEMTVTLRPSQTGIASETRHFIIHSHSQSKGWAENCTGTVILRTAEVNAIDGQHQLQRNAEEIEKIVKSVEDVNCTVPHESIYDALEQLGVAYGSTFQGLTDCRADDTRAAASITVSDTASEMPENFETKHIIHPSFLEQLVQMYWPILGAGRTSLGVVCLPSSIGSFTMNLKATRHMDTPGKSLRAYCIAEGSISNQKPSQVSMFAVADGKPVITIKDLTVAPLPAADAEEDVQPARELCFRQVWEPILEPLSLADSIRVDSPQTDTETHDASLANSVVSIIHGPSSTQRDLALVLATLVEKTFRDVKIEMTSLEELDSRDKQCICIAELDEACLSVLGETPFRVLQSTVQNSQGLLWITRGAYGQKSGDPTMNMVSGFSRAIRSESMFKFATLDLDADERLNDTMAVQAIIKVFRTVVAASNSVNTEMEFQERKGHFWTPRIENDDVVNDYVHKQSFPPSVEEAQFGSSGRDLKLALSTPGILDSFYFVDDELRQRPLADGQVEIEVKAVSLNARDVEIALGHMDESAFGQDCSGVVTNIGKGTNGLAVGDRVAAISQAAFATYTRVPVELVIKIPDAVSFEEAASIPLAQCSAHYGLIDLARLEDEDSVLILNGAGAMGQAAISVAQMIGSTVFVTVDTPEDKAVLMKGFDLPENHIFYSKNEALSTSILRASNGHGIDVVVAIGANAESIQPALSCVADFGRIVRDVSKKGNFELSGFHGNMSLFSLDIHGLIHRKPRTVSRLLKEVARSLKQGRIGTTRSAQIVPIAETVQAFKIARSNPHSNRVVVVPHTDDVVKTTPSKKVAALFNPDATYILIGGTGGLGRGMTRWMAAKGAKTIVLLSRSGSVTGHVKTLVDDMAPLGVNVVVRSCNVAKQSDVESLLEKQLVGLPPIRGVIHGAMILRDKLFDKMDLCDWTEVIESKVQGAWNFHNALKSTPLDFFILYSSSAAAMGGRGQAAYAAANSFLDAFAQYRRALGLPGASLGPTAVLDSGFLFENADMMNDVQRNIGDNYIYEAEVLSLLEAILDGTSEKSCDNHIISGVRLDPFNLPFWATDAKYKHLRIAAEAIAALANNGVKSISWNAAFKAAESLADAELVACDGLVEKIAKTLGLEVEEMDATRNLSNYSLDSLTAIDVRNFITREFESTMQVLELLASGTIQTLAKAVCAKSKILKVAK